MVASLRGQAVNEENVGAEVESVSVPDKYHGVLTRIDGDGIAYVERDDGAKWSTGVKYIRPRAPRP